MSGNTLSIFFEGTNPLLVPKSNPMYSEIREKLANGLRKGLYTIVDLAAKIKSATKGKFTLIEQDGTDVILLYGKAMDSELSDMVIKFVDAKQPTEALENFWKNCCLNPSKESRESLYGFIQANGFTLTTDGCFIGYRSVTSDFKDHRTRTMDNSVGATVSMDRNKVDPDPNNTCSSGLHVAAWDYAWNAFGGHRGTCVEVKVNPKDVVTVPPDYDNQKMRVCEFKVVSVVTQSRDTLVHPDTFNDADEVEDTSWNEVDGDDDVNGDTEKDSTVYILSVCKDGGVNIPAALARAAGANIGDIAYAFNDTQDEIVYVGKDGSLVYNQVNDADSEMVSARRFVDKHNSIRFGPALFADWNLDAGDQVEAKIDRDGDIEITVH
jgi:bifunctional DNA-binding transcriptional regulator/antitoxin component of YhaV-PrlF toxin-antitoxin module